MARYLVTGGAGFIGSHLCDALLKRGDEVIVLDDLSSGKRENLTNEAELIRGSILDQEKLIASCRDVDGVFHLAAVASVQRCNEDWAKTHEINSLGAIRVFEQAVRLDIPVVYASSAAVYGLGSNMPLLESQAMAPISAYGLDKLANEKQAEIAGKIHGLNSFGLRFFNVYGPRQDPASPYSGVISIFNDRMASNLPLKVFGDGKQSRDFIYVADIVAMLLCAMRNVKVEAPVFNACTGISNSLEKLISIFGDLYGRKAQVVYEQERDGDIRNSIGDPGAFFMNFNMRALVSLEVGLKSYLDEAVVKDEIRRAG